MRICVASSFPERLNRNSDLVRNLADGFREALPAADVRESAFHSIVALVERISPTLVVLVGSALPSPCDYAALARACAKKGTIFAYWTVEDPYEFDTNIRFTPHADVVFSNDVWAAEFYNRDNVHHLPTAASIGLKRSIRDYASRPLDVFFCGVGFRLRQQLIQDAAAILDNYRTQILGDNWPTTVGSFVQNKRVPNEDITHYYANAKVVLNLGRDHSFANETRALQSTTPGPRTFEAAMSGCVQMYYQPSFALRDYFDPETEMVCFDDVFELEAKLAFLMANPLKAQEIARAAQERCVKDHTFANRAQTILEATGLATAHVSAMRRSGAEGGGRNSDKAALNAA